MSTTYNGLPDDTDPHEAPAITTPVGTDSRTAESVNVMTRKLTDYMAFLNKYAVIAEHETDTPNTRDVFANGEWRFQDVVNFVDNLILKFAGQQDIKKDSTGVFRIGTGSGCTSDWKLIAQDAVIAILNTLGVQFDVPILGAAAAADKVPLTSKGYSGQTANLLECTDSSDVVQASIAANGDIEGEDITANGIGYFDSHIALTDTSDQTITKHSSGSGSIEVLCHTPDAVRLGRNATSGTKKILLELDGTDEDADFSNCAGGVILPSSGPSTISAYNSGWADGSPAPRMHMAGGTSGARWVSLFGQATYTGGGTGTSPFTTALPTEMRPATQRSFMVWTTESGAYNTGLIVVTTAGIIITSLPTGNSIQFDGVSYLAGT